MHENEQIEILKAILNKIEHLLCLKVNPAAMLHLYQAYKKVIAEILEPEPVPEPERLVTIRMVCSSCCLGYHDECQDGKITHIEFQDTPGRVYQAAIICLCEQCHPSNHTRTDGDSEVTLSA